MSTRKVYLIYPVPYTPFSGKYYTAKSMLQAKKIGFKLGQEFDINCEITKRQNGYITVTFEQIREYRYD